MLAMMFAGMTGRPGHFDPFPELAQVVGFFALPVLLLATALALWFCYFEAAVRPRFEQAAMNRANAGPKSHTGRSVQFR